MSIELKELVGKYDEALVKFGLLSDMFLKNTSAVDDLAKTVVALTAKVNEFGDRTGTSRLEGKDGIWENKEVALGFIKFVQAMFSGDPMKLKQMTEGTDSEGGFLVPTQFVATLVRLIDVFGQVRPLATVIPMVGNKLSIPNLVTGITPYWVGETVAPTESLTVFGLVELTAKKLAALVPASSELLEDSTIAIATLIATLVAEAFAREEDRVALIGDTTAGDPFNGILNTVGVATLTLPAGSTTFADLTADDLLDMQGQLTKAARIGARYWMEPTIEHVIMKLKAATTGEYIYAQPQDAGPGRAWGYPIETSELMPSIADAASDSTVLAAPFFFFGNMKHLFIGNRREMTVAQSPHVYFAEDMIVWRFNRRVAIVLSIPSAFCVTEVSAV